MPTAISSTPNTAAAVEAPSYLDFKGEQLFYVLHQPPEPKGVVVLPGPFATERPYSYTPWVRWARFLTRNGFAAIRFDYRGVGESTGSFADMSFAAWVEDIQFMAAWIQRQFPLCPLALHGLGLGGLLASRVFQSGCGDALLLWSAPNSGEEVLKEGFMRRLAVDYAVSQNGKRKSWQDYLNELASGLSIPVQGYPISGPLWDESKQFRLYTPGAGEGSGDARPTRTVKLDRSAAPLIAGVGQWRALNPALRIGYVPLNPDLTTLFQENLTWLEQALAASKKA